jgi:thiamine-monophosphate kinase
MFDIAGKYGLAIVGGDTVSSPCLFISVTVMGSAGDQKRGMLRRSAAKPGDQIAVTNHLGGSAGGLEMLSKNLKLKPKLAKQLRQAHLLPVPRVAEGQFLLEKGVRCGMDISDGLLGDLRHICTESSVGVKINVDLVPVAPAVKECFSDRALEMAMTGGEDYELLFTASPAVMKKVQRAAICPITIIGEIIEDKAQKVVLVDNNGKRFSLKKTGWDHFLK